MEKLKRGRASQAGGPSVLIARESVSLSRYQELLDAAAEYLAARLGARPPATKLAIARAARALLCGRIVAGKTPFEMQRCIYCRTPTLCRCCHANIKAAAAKQLADDPTKNYGKKLLGLVVTLPDPPDRAASRDMAIFAATKLRPQLRRTLTAWQRRKDRKYELGSYAINLHLKHRSLGHYWPHLHMAVFVDRHCSVQEFKNHIHRSLELVFDPKPVPVITCKKWGVLGRYRSHQASRQLKQAKVCTSTTAEALFAYVLRTTENDEVPLVSADRDQFMDEVLNSPTFTRSRSKTSEQHWMPAEFDPDALGKPHVYYFPFDSGASQKIEPSEYEQVRARLAAEATRLITNRFNILP